MQAQCEINLTEDDICIEIQGREKLSVFIDDTEQDTTQNICELKQFNKIQRIRSVPSACTIKYGAL